MSGEVSGVKTRIIQELPGKRINKLRLIRAVCAFVCHYTEEIALITSAYNFTSDFQFATMNEFILGQW
jgi:hypothetical protein